MNEKILICDDEPYILESVSYVVRAAGFIALTASDGEEALRLAREEKPALMILDIMLPLLSGLDVCARMKNDPRTKDIHIIILSARGQEIDEAQGLESGADEYLTKPFSPRKLKQRLEEIFLGKGGEHVFP